MEGALVQDGSIAGFCASEKRRRIGLIGCRGRMGSMLCRRWAAVGHELTGIDLPLADEAFAAAARNADVVVLCIPAGAMVDTLRGLVPHLDKRQILMDITSVKIHPLNQMQAAYGGPVVGTHPLFGPDPGKADSNVCITPGSSATEADITLVENLYRDLHCSVFRSTAEEHDRAAAAIQGLNFITNAAYFATLAHRRELLPYLTPSFLRRMEAARKMLMEDAALFEWLFEANPLSQEAVRRYRSFLNLAAGGDINILVQQARWWWEREND